MNGIEDIRRGNYVKFEMATAGATKLFRSVTKMIVVATNQLSAHLFIHNLE